MCRVPARPPRPGPSRSLSLAAGGDVGSCLGTAGTGGRRGPSPGTVPVGKAGGAETRLGEQAHARVGEDQAGRSGSSPEPPMSHPHPPMTNRRDVSLDTEKKPGGVRWGTAGPLWGHQGPSSLLLCQRPCQSPHVPEAPSPRHAQLRRSETRQARVIRSAGEVGRRDREPPGGRRQEGTERGPSGHTVALPPAASCPARRACCSSRATGEMPRP